MLKDIVSKARKHKVGNIAIVLRLDMILGTVLYMADSLAKRSYHQFLGSTTTILKPNFLKSIGCWNICISGLATQNLQPIPTLKTHKC